MPGPQQGQSLLFPEIDRQHPRLVVTYEMLQTVVEWQLLIFSLLLLGRASISTTFAWQMVKSLIGCHLGAVTVGTEKVGGSLTSLGEPHNGDLLANRAC